MGYKIAVIMSVYYHDKSVFVREALESLYAQTVQADIFIQEDGLLPKDLARYLDEEYKKGKITYLGKRKENVGLAMSLNELLDIVPETYDLIARMDADDIALPDRFEKQVQFMMQYSNVDIVGGWICEFDTDVAQCEKERRTPLADEEIRRFAVFRNPMNHVTVMYRREAVDAVGGYEHMNGFEDYYLWMRMLKNGSIFANIPQLLVKVRTGEGMIKRRRGWQYTKDEWVFEQAAYRLGFWSKKDLLRNLFIRILPRLLPEFVVEKLYNLLRKF